MGVDICGNANGMLGPDVSSACKVASLCVGGDNCAAATGVVGEVARMEGLTGVAVCAVFLLNVLRAGTLAPSTAGTLSVFDSVATLADGGFSLGNAKGLARVLYAGAPMISDDFVVRCRPGGS
ncbi:MAG: hypothetical protein HKN47_14175 [Pirellulaceae bacterium]|nr:hypothetical protein [Pirellulaceae bacterium]